MAEKIGAVVGTFSKDLKQRGADFVDYMERCVAQREELDARFESQRAQLRQS